MRLMLDYGRWNEQLLLLTKVDIIATIESGKKDEAIIKYIRHCFGLQ